MTTRSAGSLGKTPRSARLRLLAVASVPVALLGSLTACSDGEGGGVGGSSDEWVIGGIVDQTGAASSAGEASKTAFEFWVDKFNKEGGAGGRKLRIEFCDSKSTPAGGAQCAAEVASVNSHVVVLLTALPAAQGAQTRLADDVTLSIIPVLFPEGGSKTFQIAPLLDTVVQPLIAMAKANSIDSLGVIYTSDSSGTANLKAMEAVASEAGLKVVSSPMEPTATDVTPQLVQLKSEGAGLIFAGTVGSPTNVVASSADTLGFSVPIVVGAGNVSNSFLKSLPNGIPDNLYGVATLAKGPDFPDEVTTAWTSFQADYQEATGQPVDSIGSSFAYTSCLMKAAIDETKASSADAIQKFILGQTTTCLGSPLSFSNPALNVATGVPAQVVKAGSDGWVPAGPNF